MNEDRVGDGGRRVCARSRQARRRRSTRSLGAYRGNGEAGVREGEREGEGGFVWVGDALQRLRATARWSRRAAPFGQRPTAARWEKAAPRPACGAAEGPRRARPPSARSPQPTRRRPRPISNNLARSRAHLGRSRWVDPKDGGRERVRSRPISREAQGHLSREELTAPRHCARAARPRGNSSAGSRRCGAAGRASGGRGAAPPPTRGMPTRRTHPRSTLPLAPVRPDLQRSLLEAPPRAVLLDRLAQADDQHGPRRHRRHEPRRPRRREVRGAAFKDKEPPATQPTVQPPPHAQRKRQRVEGGRDDAPVVAREVEGLLLVRERVHPRREGPTHAQLRAQHRGERCRPASDLSQDVNIRSCAEPRCEQAPRDTERTCHLQERRERRQFVWRLAAEDCTAGVPSKEHADAEPCQGKASRHCKSGPHRSCPGRRESYVEGRSSLERHQRRGQVFLGLRRTRPSLEVSR